MDHSLLFLLCAFSGHYLAESPGLCSEQHLRPGDDERGGRVYQASSTAHCGLRNDAAAVEKMRVSAQGAVSFLSAPACSSRNPPTASTEISTDPEKHYYTGGRLKPTDGRLAVFHFLVPLEKAVIADEDRAAWHGRIHAVAKATQELIEKEKEEEKTERDTLKKHMGKLEVKLQKLEEIIEKKMEKLQAMLEQKKQDQNESSTKAIGQESETPSLQTADV